MLKKILQHKIITGIIILIIIIGGYFGYKTFRGSTANVSYVSAAAEKGTIVLSVSGSGQVSASNQIDIKPEVSSTVLSINKQNGQYVSEGDVIAQLDIQDAEKAIRDAQSNLETAQLQFDIFKQSSGNMANLISDAFNGVSDTFLDLPSIIAGIQQALFDPTIASYENLINEPQGKDILRPLILTAQSDYIEARTMYDNAFSAYHAITRNSSQETMLNFISETLDTSTKISDTIKDTINIIDFINDYNAQRSRTLLPVYANLVSTYRSNLNSYTSQINSHIASLTSIQSSFNNAPLNLRSQQLSLQQKENTLIDAQNNLTDYTIKAPFNGILTNMNLNVSDSVSSSTTIATLVTTNKFAEMPLNEVDVAKVKVGQKATITFDAIPDLTITGKVASVDLIGTISQGVVTYNVKIIFDTQDERVKPGMSVSAAIITDSKQDVILVSNSAVKLSGNTTYVEVLTDNIPYVQTVETGISNDTMTEIISGLNEGDQVVTQTITAANSSSQTSSQQNSTFRIPGLTGGSSGR